MTRATEPSKDIGDNAEKTASIEQTLLITEMMKQIAIMQKKFQAEGEDEERRWMMAHTQDRAVIEFLKEATVLTLHVIDAIGESEPVNGITISKRFGIPRGSVSKITRRLAEQGVVQAESLPDNKKEVLFRLTPSGWHIFKLHQQLHTHIEHNVRKFLGRYDLEQLSFLTQCMKETAEASWVQLDESEGEPEANKGIAAAPDEAGAPAPDIGETGEIVAMLQQLDAKGLKKAKELLRIAFFDT